MIQIPRDTVVFLESPGTDLFWGTGDGRRIWEDEVQKFGVKIPDGVFVSPNKRTFSSRMARIHHGDEHYRQWLTCSFSKAKISKESMTKIMSTMRKPKSEVRVMRADEVKPRREYENDFADIERRVMEYYRQRLAEGVPSSRMASTWEDYNGYRP